MSQECAERVIPDLIRDLDGNDVKAPMRAGLILARSILSARKHGDLTADETVRRIERLMTALTDAIERHLVSQHYVDSADAALVMLLSRIAKLPEAHSWLLQSSETESWIAKYLTSRRNTSVCSAWPLRKSPSPAPNAPVRTVAVALGIAPAQPAPLSKGHSVGALPVTSTVSSAMESVMGSFISSAWRSIRTSSASLLMASSATTAGAHPSSSTAMMSRKYEGKLYGGAVLKELERSFIRVFKKSVATACGEAAPVATSSDAADEGCCYDSDDDPQDIIGESVVITFALQDLDGSVTPIPLRLSSENDAETCSICNSSSSSSAPLKTAATARVSASSSSSTSSSSSSSVKTTVEWVGIVATYDDSDGTHSISFDNGKRMSFNMSTIRWRFAADDE